MAKIFKPDGSVFEGKSHKVVDPSLRHLPSEYVTDEVGEADKVHRLDPEHVRHGILKDIAEQETGRDVEFNFKDFMSILVSLPSEVKRGRVTRFKYVQRPQWEVDLIRTRICAVFTMQAIRHERIENLTAPFYVWFPDDNLNKYIVREGHAPANRDRPHYLRRIDLFIDLLKWPCAVLDYLKEIGLHVEMAGDLVGRLIDDQRQQRN